MELKKYIGNQIKELRLKRGMNQEKLAELLNTTKQTVSRYENGDRTANQDILFQLSEVFGVCIDDFFPDRGDASEEKNNVIPFPGVQYPYLPTTISAGLPINVDGITDANKISVPDVVMGKWTGSKDIFFTRISGDSMNNVMEDGSLIAIKKVDNVENLKDGDMVVFSRNHEYSVKYFYKTDDKLIFKPDSTNKEHHEQHFTTSEEIRIHGKVILHIAEFD